MLSLDHLNRLRAPEFVAALASIFEHSPWVAERVADARHAGERLATKHCCVNGTIPPAGDAQPLRTQRVSKTVLVGSIGLSGSAEEEHADRKRGRGFRQQQPCFRREHGLALRHKQLPRNGRENANAVRRLAVCSDRPAMQQPRQRSKPLGEQLVRSLSRNLRDKTCAAGVMVIAGIKEGRSRRGRALHLILRQDVSTKTWPDSSLTRTAAAALHT